MSDEVDVDGNEVIEEDSKENENDDYLSNIMKNNKINIQTHNSNRYTITRSKLFNIYETKNDEEDNNDIDDDEREKATELESNKRKKQIKLTNKSINNKNPPKRKKEL